jgi:YHS domain-containing protein
MRASVERNGSVWSPALAVLVFLAFLAVTAGPSRAAEQGLAIGGYDPVAYYTEGTATKGDPSFEYVWDDDRYRFASAENRERFKASPEQYAPQFPGFCAMSLANGAKVVPNPENWLISDGKLYLFGKAIGPDRFGHDLAENVAHANANWQRVQHGEALAAPNATQ